MLMADWLAYNSRFYKALGTHGACGKKCAGGASARTHVRTGGSGRGLPRFPALVRWHRVEVARRTPHGGDDPYRLHGHSPELHHGKYQDASARDADQAAERAVFRTGGRLVVS